MAGSPGLRVDTSSVDAKAGGVAIGQVWAWTMTLRRGQRRCREADAAVTHAKLGAELAVQTGSALAARELRLVRTVLRKAGADAALSELTEHMRDITATS